MTRKKIVGIMVVVMALTSHTAFGSETANTGVQDAMVSYVQTQSAADGLMPILYQGKILRLELAKSKKYPTGFHSGVKSHGNLYASCADFVNPKTQDKYDVDFIVSKTGAKYNVVQPLVHSVNGKKNPYDLH